MNLINLKTAVKFIQNREVVRVHRLLGIPKPWTTDPIIGKFRFCNIRREDDKVTIFIRDRIRNPIDMSYPKYLPEAVAVARYFNLPSTLSALIRAHCLIGKPDEACRVLASLPLPIFNAAYIIPTAGFPKPKHEAVLKGIVPEFVAKEPTFRRDTVEHWAHDALQCRGVGRFFAHQLALDLVFTSHLSHCPDKLDFAILGPGAERGLRRLHPTKVTIDGLREVQKVINNETGFDLSLADVENCMCEVDKYLRAFYGEGTPKQRYP